jgi:hypothetical protein
MLTRPFSSFHATREPVHATAHRPDPQWFPDDELAPGRLTAQGFVSTALSFPYSEHLPAPVQKDGRLRAATLITNATLITVNM